MAALVESSSRGRVAFAWAVPPGLVGMAAIAVAAAVLVHLDLSGRAFVAAGFSAALVVLAAIDLERRIIPNRIVLPAAAIVLLGDIVARPDRAKEWIVAALAAGLGAGLVAIVTRGGIGMGDAKLCLLIGAGLGWSVVGAVVYALLATFPAALVVLARRGLAGRKDAMPFGPFLALGAIVALLLS